MKKHIKIYFDYYDYTEADIIQCEVCYNRGFYTIATDIHHIQPKGMGGTSGKDIIENLIALCRKCHEDAHKAIYTKEFLFDLNVELKSDQLSQLAEDLNVGISCYQDMISDSIPRWNPAEDKVKELTKKMETMHEDKVIRYYEDQVEQYQREIKRLRLLVDDLQTKLNNS